MCICIATYVIDFPRFRGMFLMFLLPRYGGEIDNNILLP